MNNDKKTTKPLSGHITDNGETYSLWICGRLMAIRDNTQQLRTIAEEEFMIKEELKIL